MLTIPKAFPDLMIFKPNKKRLLLFSIGLWSILILLECLFYWTWCIVKNISSEGSFAFCGLLMLMPVLFFYNLIAFLPKEGWLTLDSEGFCLNSHLKSRRFKYKWDDIQEIFLTHQVINHTQVERISFSVHIAGIFRQKHFPTYRYQISTKEIVQILNDWKQQYTHPVEATYMPLDTSGQPYSTSETTSRKVTAPSASSPPVQYPPTDARIEKITNRWGCGLAIIGVLLFIAFIVTADSTERTIYKFYNFQKNAQPSLTLTVNKKYSEESEVYHLPPIPYKHKLELSVPTPERGVPIQIQYTANHQTQCRKLEKQYGILGSMDAIWVNSSGNIDAYATDFCKKVGRYDCRFIPDKVDISECAADGLNPALDSNKQNVVKDAHITITPLSPSDFKRLKEKKGITF